MGWGSVGVWVWSRWLWEIVVDGSSWGYMGGDGNSGGGREAGLVEVVVLECMVILWIFVVMVGREVVEVMLVLGWKGVVGDGSDGVVVMGKGVMAGGGELVVVVVVLVGVVVLLVMIQMEEN